MAERPIAGEIIADVDSLVRIIDAVMVAHSPAEDRAAARELVACALRLAGRVVVDLNRIADAVERSAEGAGQTRDDEHG